MKYLILICLFLSACDTVQERDSISVIRDNAAQRIAHFNEITNSHVPMPSISFGTPSNTDRGNYASAYKTGEIIIEPTRCLSNMDECLNDTLPHELAHEAVFYLLPGQNISHGPTWCDAMRKMGGKPENEKWENCHLIGS